MAKVSRKGDAQSDGDSTRLKSSSSPDGRASCVYSRTRWIRWPLKILGLYLLLVLSLVIPWVQRHFIYLHAINFPFQATFHTPERYGLSPHKARNVYLKTEDDLQIGAWHILPDEVYRSLLPSLLDDVKTSGGSSNSTTARIKEEEYDESLCTHPTILYLHGNAGNRAAPFRITSYIHFSSRLNLNVLAIDYRGFGDSQGVPSEEGLVKDVQSAWDWIQSRRSICKAKAKEGGETPKVSSQSQTEERSGKGIFIMGQSLGTGPAVSFTLQLLAERGETPQGLVLLAPYRSLIKVAQGYTIGGLIPILRPALYLIPFAQRGLGRALRTRFDSEASFATLGKLLEKKRREGELKGSFTGGNERSLDIFISHATDDEVIPYSHGEALFDTLLHSQKLDAGLNSGPEDEDLPLPQVRSQTIKDWATIHQFDLSSPNDMQGSKGDNRSTVTLVRSRYGGHNTVPEGVVDLIREVMRI